MTNNDLSDAMQKEVKKILDKVQKDSMVANITMTFTSPKQPDYKVYLCREIESISIHQDFVQNITDKITVELKMERDPYIGMLYMRKNMKCSLSITYTKPDEVLDDKAYAKKAHFSLDYKAVLIKYEDLFKKFTSEQLFPEKRRENDHDRKTFLMTVELIAEDVYKARKQAMYFTGRDTTMYDMLRYTCNYFGFSKALIVKPDNTKQYTNFVIPPAYHVEEIMSFLQNSPGMGIYKNGLVSYIMNHLWYVYPRYGNPIENYTTHVYCLGGNKFAGLNRMDWDENEVQSSSDESTSKASSGCNGGGSTSTASQKAANALAAVDAKDTAIAAAKIYTGTATAKDYVTVAKNAKKAYDAANSDSSNNSSSSNSSSSSSSSSSSCNKPSGDGGSMGPGYGPVRGKKPVRIISFSELKETNWNNIGSENEPTCLVAQMMDLIVDHSRRLVDDNTTVLERCIHYPDVVPAEAMDYDQFVRIQHVKSRANLYTLCSQTRALQGKTLTFEWEHARPWVFHPAASVTVHYDNHSKMEEHVGIVEKADYTFSKDQTNRIFPRWTCKATIEVFCSIREKKLIQSKM